MASLRYEIDGYPDFIIPIEYNGYYNDSGYFMQIADVNEFPTVQQWCESAVGFQSLPVTITLNNGNQMRITQLSTSGGKPNYGLQFLCYNVPELTEVQGNQTNSNVFNYARMLVAVPVEAVQKYVTSRFPTVATPVYGDGDYLLCNSLVPSKSPGGLYDVNLNGNYLDFGVGALGTTVTIEQFFLGQPTWKGNSSTEGGGDGVFEMDSDTVDFPTLPSGILNYGLITAYDVTPTNLIDLSKFLWSDLFSDATVKKLFQDPMSAIIGLHLLPLTMQDYDNNYNIIIGTIDSGIPSKVVRSQFLTRDMGSLTVPKYYGNAIDYSPYTRVSIYLPFIGTQQLDIDTIAGKELHLIYNIDVLTGSLTALVAVNGSVQYQYSGNCLMPIPLTSNNMASAFNSVLQFVGNIGLTIGTGGTSAPVTIPAAAASVAGMKPDITKSSPTGSSCGYLGVQQPYLIYEFPNQSLPKSYNKFCGYPSNITSALSSLKGYTQVERVHLENIPATPTELDEIEAKLKAGVIL